MNPESFLSNFRGSYYSEALGTGNALLWYGICVPCAKQAPVVRDAFSEALGAQNKLLRYGRDIRCAKQAPEVRDFCDQISKEKALFVASNSDPKDVSTRDNFFDK